ncbi:MAG: Hsp20/alpha crystallin family protein [Pseudomonadota bacterium]|nr:Hsp20/alpha crystallin family protein [Pseudomonadota bacterium]
MAQISKEKSSLPASRAADPFSLLHGEIDRLFDSFIGGGFPTLRNVPAISAAENGTITPHIDVRESDKQIVVEAELPGIDEKDVSVSLQDGVLTIKGEKKFEKKEEKDDYVSMERRYGSFQRAMRLPEGIDEDKVKADFAKGVLTVTLPKSPEAAKKEKKISISAR